MLGREACGLPPPPVCPIEGLPPPPPTCPIEGRAPPPPRPPPPPPRPPPPRAPAIGSHAIRKMTTTIAMQNDRLCLFMAVLLVVAASLACRWWTPRDGNFEIIFQTVAHDPVGPLDRKMV